MDVLREDRQILGPTEEDSVERQGWMMLFAVVTLTKLLKVQRGRQNDSKLLTRFSSSMLQFLFCCGVFLSLGTQHEDGSRVCGYDKAQSSYFGVL